MNFSSKIKKLRIAKRLTQKQIADYLNVSQNAIYNWENGKREPNMDMQKQIAKFFDFPLYLLLDDNYELDNVELEMKRAKPYKSYEMLEPPGPFTVPLSQYNNGNNIYKNLREIALQQELDRGSSTNRDKETFKTPPPSDSDLNNNIYKYDGSIRANQDTERERLDEEAQKLFVKQASGEKITEEEAQKIYDFIERTREDYDKLNENIKNFSKILSTYLNENTQIPGKDFQMLQEKLQMLTDMFTMPDFYETLNNIGRKKAADYISDLSNIPEYRKDSESEPSTPDDPQD